MKERASFTFDKETIKILDSLVDSGEFRNRSHAVEHSIKKLIEEISKKEDKVKK